MAEDILSPIQPEDNGLAFTDPEIRLIKKLFASNDAMLMAIRNHMLQFPLSENEQGLLKTLDEEAITFLRDRVFLPRANKTSKLGKIGDVWGSVGVKDMSPDEAYPHFLAREKQIAYYAQQLLSLDQRPTVAEYYLSDMVANIASKEPLQVFVDFAVRNTILIQTDYHLNLLKTFAGQKEETPEEAKKRLQANSAE